MPDMILHNYFRSSTSIRVRVALNLKGLDYHYASYALLDKEHKSDSYLELNPQGLVPSLQISPEKVLGQSLAIIEYLNDEYPDPPLFPADSWGRARVRSMALMVACEIHPLNNLIALNTLKSDFGADDSAVKHWFSKWVHRTFSALENKLTNDSESGNFCHGDAPTVADICLYAQVINNQRFEVDMAGYPRINEIYARCADLEAFANAHPTKQPDAF